MFNIIGILILLMSILVIIRVFKSSASNGVKALWIIAILLLPMIGMISWYFAGPGDKSLSLKI